MLWRQSSTENSSGTITGHVENSVIVDGQYLGGTGDATLDSEAAAAGTLPFSLSFTPVSGAGAPQSTGPSTYIVSSGDTLESIAKSAYGDASLWTDIASANGLSDNSVLTPGEVLIIPNQAQLNINGAQTYKPYNATTAEGINGPQVPNPGGASSGCGVAGELLIVAITVAISIETSGAINLEATAPADLTADAAVDAGTTTAVDAGATTAVDTGATVAGTGAAAGGAGAITVGSAFNAGVALLGSNFTVVGGLELAAGAVVGNAVQQELSIAVGLQKSFSFGELIESGIGAFASGAVGGVLGAAGTSVVKAGVNAAVADAATQGIGDLLGVHKGFNWDEVAGATAGAAASTGVSDALDVDSHSPTIPAATKFAAGAAAGLTGGVVASLVGSGRLEATQIATDAFGNAVGNAFASVNDPSANMDANDIRNTPQYQAQIQALTGNYPTDLDANDIRASSGYQAQINEEDLEVEEDNRDAAISKAAAGYLPQPTAPISNPSLGGPLTQLFPASLFASASDVLGGSLPLSDASPGAGRPGGTPITGVMTDQMGTTKYYQIGGLAGDTPQLFPAGPTLPPLLLPVGATATTYSNSANPVLYLINGGGQLNGSYAALSFPANFGYFQESLS